MEFFRHHTLQIAELSDVFNAIGIDHIEKRLEVALANGAKKVYNPKIYWDSAYIMKMQLMLMK